MRDFDKFPYSKDEQRVVDYLAEIIPDVGAGDDPILFLIASHASLRSFLKEIDEKVRVLSE